MIVRRSIQALACALAALSFACSKDDAGKAPQADVIILSTPAPAPTSAPTPRPTPRPTPTPLPTPEVTPLPTAPPTPAPTARPAVTAAPAPTPVPAPLGAALVLGDGVAVRSRPTTQSGEVVRRLHNQQSVTLLGTVQGEQWIVGDQTWAMAPHSWTRTWYQVEDGYIYSAFVFVPGAGEATPFVRATGERVIDVSVSTQRLQVLVGDQPVYSARVTTGKPGFDTPIGTYRLGGNRVYNETMTSAQAAIDDPAEAYNVKNVLYTQYFTNAGDALHLNYWQPESFFGAQRTSHGCVGLLLHDAQWLWLFVQPGTRLVVHV